MHPKTVVVIPGNYWQIPLVQKSKSMGFRTLVINPYPDSAAFPYADGYLQSDIFDTENVIKYCREQKVNAIVSDVSDIAIPVMAELGYKLSLKTLNAESAQLFTNKHAMRCFCKIHEIPIPEYQLCETVEQAESFFDATHDQIVIKPLDCNGSRGVYTISQRDMVCALFNKALEFSRTQKAVLAERYIDGTEFTVDGIKTPERHFTLAISEKKHFAHNPNIACELYFSGYNSRYNYEALALQNDRLIEQSPLEFGLTHAEYKYENGTFYLIEVAARGGGSLISSHIVPFLSGVDNYQYLIEYSLGMVKCSDFTVPKRYENRCAVLHFFDVPRDGGVVSGIEGLDLLAHNTNIVKYQFNIKAGDTVADATSDADRAGFYIACCENQNELDALMLEIQNNVRIICKPSAAENEISLA
ncbi:MAG: ATP-grasp domain-containing protein [Clostridiales bacterium]|nr:ATP-grasp domain-containing protein [Clostridiales bacterium]